MLDPTVKNAIDTLRQNGKSPLCAYIYDLPRLFKHVEFVKSHLPSQCQLFYAMKANSNDPILRTLAPLVDGYEVASIGEIYRGRAISPSLPIMFGGPGKTEEELEGALLHHVHLLNVESLTELQRIETMAQQKRQTVPILLRINIQGTLPSATLRMGGMPTQFGLDETDLPKAMTIIKRSHALIFRGYHFHSISNNLNSTSHLHLIAKYIRRAKAWSAQYRLPLDILNVGGGIGVNYQNIEHQFDWLTFTKGLKDLCRTYCSAGLKLVFELGRYLTAACGYYAAEVLDLKRSHGKWYVIIRGGTHHFRLPASWQHSHPFTIFSIPEWNSPIPRITLRSTKVRVVGQLCTPKDILAKDIAVPIVRLGDVVVFQYAGAYGWAISHHEFLSHPPPQQIYLTQPSPPIHAELDNSHCRIG